MKEVKQNFKDIMFVELRDLRQDLELLIEECRERSIKDHITERVFQENAALFKNEILGLQEFSDILEAINPKSYMTLDEMIRELVQQFKEKIKSADLAEAILICINRKMNKVAKYVLAS